MCNSVTYPAQDVAGYVCMTFSTEIDLGRATGGKLFFLITELVSVSTTGGSLVADDL